MSWLCFPLAWPSSQSSHQYLAFKIWSRTSKLVSVNCTLPKLYKFTRFLDLRGVLRIFAGVLQVILGAVMCIKICVGARDENGLVCTWDAARMQPVEFDGILKTGSF